MVLIQKSHNSYHINRCDSLERLADLEKDWNELLDATPNAPIFLTLDWIRTWWLFFGQNRQLWVLTIEDIHGRIQGIAPLMREDYQKGLVRLRIITFIGTGKVCPTDLKFLTRTSDKEGIYRAILDYLQDQSAQWDVLKIGSVAEDSPDYPLLISLGGHLRIGHPVNCLYIPLPDNWDSYINGISRNLRHTIRSSNAKLEVNFPGKVKFECVKDLKEIDCVMVKLEELVRNRCHTNKIFTDWDDLDFTSFHRAIANKGISHGWLRLYSLTVDNQLIAVLYTFQYNGCLYAYNAGYDFKWSRYSPSSLLFSYCLQDAMQNSIRLISMGVGSAKYKWSWTDHYRIENEILFSSNWKGNLWIFIKNLKKNVKNKTKQVSFQPTSIN